MTTTDADTDRLIRLALAQERLGLDDPAFEVFTQERWQDAYCYTDMIEIQRRITERFERDLPSLVFHAMKRDGASWTDIGNALGISRQAAQQRFGR